MYRFIYWFVVLLLRTLKTKTQRRGSTSSEVLTPGLKPKSGNRCDRLACLGHKPVVPFCDFCFQSEKYQNADFNFIMGVVFLPFLNFVLSKLRKFT